MIPKIQKDFLLLFRCIVDFGAEVLRDFTEEKIKIHYNTGDFRTFLENTKHNFYHQFDKKKVACCECPPHGCIPKTGQMDQKIYSKLYVYNSSMKFPKGHLITNGSSTIQICICRYNARTLMLTDLDLSDLNALLIGLRSINTPVISHSESTLINEMMSVRGKVCHAVTSTTFLEPELINLWTKFTNALYNLCPGDPKYVKWLKKTIETTKKTILSEEEVYEVMGTIGMLSTDVRNFSEDLMNLMNDKTTDITNVVKTESTGIKTYFDNTLQPFTEQQTRHSELLLECEKTVCQTVSNTAQNISTCMEKEGIKNRGHSTELLQTLENNQKANFEKLTEKMIGHLDKLFGSHPVFAGAYLPSILTENVNENDACTHRKIKIQAKITQSSLTEENEEKIIQTLSPVIEVPNVESEKDTVQEQKMYVMAKKVNSIELELDVSAEILVNKETFRRAILTLVKTVIVAGEVQTKNADPIHAILTFDSSITKDEKATVTDLLTTPDRSGAQSKEETIQTSDGSYCAAMENEDATLICNGCKEKEKLIQQLINFAADTKERSVTKDQDVSIVRNENEIKAVLECLLGLKVKAKEVTCAVLEDVNLKGDMVYSSLMRHKHSIFHMCNKERCCQCPSLFRTMLGDFDLSDKEYETIFEKFTHICRHAHVGTCICCWRCKQGITEKDLPFPVMIYLLVHSFSGAKYKEQLIRIASTTSQINDLEYRNPNFDFFKIWRSLSEDIICLASAISKQYQERIETEIVAFIPNVPLYELIVFNSMNHMKTSVTEKLITFHEVIQSLKQDLQPEIVQRTLREAINTENEVRSLKTHFMEKLQQLRLTLGQEVLQVGKQIQEEVHELRNDMGHSLRPKKMDKPMQDPFPIKDQVWSTPREHDEVYMKRTGSRYKRLNVVKNVESRRVDVLSSERRSVLQFINERDKSTKESVVKVCPFTECSLDTQLQVSESTSQYLNSKAGIIPLGAEVPKHFERHFLSDKQLQEPEQFHPKYVSKSDKSTVSSVATSPSVDQHIRLNKHVQKPDRDELTLGRAGQTVDSKKDLQDTSPSRPDRELLNYSIPEKPYSDKLVDNK